MTMNEHIRAMRTKHDIIAAISRLSMWHQEVVVGDLVVDYMARKAAKRAAEWNAFVAFWGEP